MSAVDTLFIADIRENFQQTWTIYSKQTIRKHIDIVNTITTTWPLSEFYCSLCIKQFVVIKNFIFVLLPNKH